MELYTSYWKNQGLANLDVIPVGISRGAHRGRWGKNLPYRWKRLAALYPSKNLLERWTTKTITPEEYTLVYRSYLDSLGPEEVKSRLEKKSVDNGGKALALLCFCEPGAFCHRRAWADWYHERTGQEVQEMPAA